MKIIAPNRLSSETTESRLMKLSSLSSIFPWLYVDPFAWNTLYVHRTPYKVVVRTCFVSRWRLATFVISRRKTGSNFCHGFFTERKFRIQVEHETRVHVRTRNTAGERRERVDFYTSCWIHDRLRRSIISREKDRGNPHGEHVRQRGRRTLVKEPFNRIR